MSVHCFCYQHRNELISIYSLKSNMRCDRLLELYIKINASQYLYCTNICLLLLISLNKLHLIQCKIAVCTLKK